jgi:ribosomal protein L11 methyltransferase
MRWVEIAVDSTDASADAVSNILIEEGCGGTAVGALSVSGYLPVDDRLEARLQSVRDRVSELPSLGLDIGAGELTVKWVNDDEWATAWKKFFKPLRVGRVVVKPSWEEFEPREGDVIVEIDPGMAFGTGNHPTTQLCLELLQDYVKGGEVVLDMGTGSGILAIAAAKLGAARVVGLDVDTVAVEAAVENVRLSGLENVISIGREDSPSAFQGAADIVVANIIAKVIIEMSAELAAAVRPGGVLIASGIIQDRAEDVKSALAQSELASRETRHEGEWVAIVCERA